jgi:hypothetical protein
MAKDNPKSSGDKHPPVCPECGLGDQVYRVSEIYVAGSEVVYRIKSEGEALAVGLSPQRLKALRPLLSPPQSSKKKGFIRPISPDQLVVGFSLILPFVLYGIYTDQPQSLLFALLAIAGVYGLYFWQRKTLMARFNAELAKQAAENERIVRAVERWLMLYYCERDAGVFASPQGPLIPLDDIEPYLMR